MRTRSGQSNIRWLLNAPHRVNRFLINLWGVSMADRTPLKVSSITLDQKREILKLASEIPKFEIERFWHRSLFFWGFIAAAFVAYAQTYDKSPLIALSVACFGVVCSTAWTLGNRGGKYWQEAWKKKVEAVESCVLGTNLFSNREPREYKGFWGASDFSVSRLAIALSDFAVLIWTILLTKSIYYSNKWYIAYGEKSLDHNLHLFVSITIPAFSFIYVVLLFYRTNTSRAGK